MVCFRQKTRASQQGTQHPPPAPAVKGPNEDNIKAILARTGYTLDVTTGKYNIFKFRVANHLLLEMTVI